MTCFLIDPFAQEVKELDEALGWRDILRIIQADMFCPVHLRNGDICWLDDNGLYRQDQHFFQADFYPQPLAGRGLVTGPEDDDGNILPPRTTLEHLRSSIIFLDRMKPKSEATVRRLSRLTLIEVKTKFEPS